MSFVPAFSHQPEAARSLIAAALKHTWYGVSPIVRSWLHCVASEVEGRAACGRASRHQVDLAIAAIGTDALAPDWLDFYDEARLRSFCGYAALAAGDNANAAEHLAASLESLRQSGTKQRSVVLADLAAASGDDRDQAADYLNQALTALHGEWYRTGFERVRAVRPVLGDSRNARPVDERIAALTALNRPELADR